MDATTGDSFNKINSCYVSPCYFICGVDVPNLATSRCLHFAGPSRNTVHRLLGDSVNEGRLRWPMESLDESMQVS